MRRYCKFTEKALYCTLWISICGSDYEPAVRQTKWWLWCWWWWWCAYTIESLLNTDSDTLENDPPQHDSPTACVIAHQYSSFIFFSFRCRSRKEISPPISKLILFLFLLLWNVLLRLLRPNLKLRKVWERLYIRMFGTNIILTGQGRKMLLLFPHFVTLNIQPVTAGKLIDAALTTL
jgi:hypothetical protein